MTKVKLGYYRRKSMRFGALISDLYILVETAKNKARILHPVHKSLLEITLSDFLNRYEYDNKLTISMKFKEYLNS